MDGKSGDHLSTDQSFTAKYGKDRQDTRDSRGHPTGGDQRALLNGKNATSYLCPRAPAMLAGVIDQCLQLRPAFRPMPSVLAQQFAFWLRNSIEAEMFYHCTKYQFKLERPSVASGGIIAASSQVRMQLLRRQRTLVKSYPHLAHRLFDPQMYLAQIPQTSKAVPNLATYPWFGIDNPPFRSSEHTIPEWKAANEAELRQSWTCAVPTQDAAIYNAVRSCIEFQQKFGLRLWESSCLRL